MINLDSQARNRIILIALLIVWTGNIWYANYHVAKLVQPEQKHFLTHDEHAKDLPDDPLTKNISSAEALPLLKKSSMSITSTTVEKIYNFTVGICDIIKDMDPYLAEWLDYHLGAMNIENIYLYDHSRANYLKNWYKNTRSHPLYSRVHVVHWKSEIGFAQGEAYTDCVTKFGRNVAKPYYLSFRNPSKVIHRTLGITEGHDYLILIDGDEFILPKGNYTSVHGVVNDYLVPYGGALTMNWMLFGSSNKTFYSPIPVTKRFQYREKEADAVIKTIVKASDFVKVRNPHAVFVRQGTLVRTTEYKGAIHKFQFPESYSKTGATDPKIPSSVILVYHYKYMSEKEYDEKNCLRGHMAGKSECNSKTKRTYTLVELQQMKKQEHIAIKSGTVFDDLAWKLLCERVPKYQMYDNASLWADYT